MAEKRYLRANVILEPLFLSCSDEDHTFDSASRKRALEICRRGQKTWHLQLFSGVSHGFALRGDPNDPYQRAFSVLPFLFLIGYSRKFASRMGERAKFGRDRKMVRLLVIA